MGSFSTISHVSFMKLPSMLSKDCILHLTRKIATDVQMRRKLSVTRDNCFPNDEAIVSYW